MMLPAESKNDLLDVLVASRLLGRHIVGRCWLETCRQKQLSCGRS